MLRSSLFLVVACIPVPQGLQDPPAETGRPHGGLTWFHLLRVGFWCIPIEGIPAGQGVGHATTQGGIENQVLLGLLDVEGA